MMKTVGRLKPTGTSPGVTKPDLSGKISGPAPIPSKSSTSAVSATKPSALTAFKSKLQGSQEGTPVPSDTAPGPAKPSAITSFKSKFQRSPSTSEDSPDAPSPAEGTTKPSAFASFKSKFKRSPSPGAPGAPAPPAPPAPPSPPPPSPFNPMSGEEKDTTESDIALSKTDQLMVGFDIIYIIFGTFGCLMVFFIFLLMTIDMAKYIKDSTVQQITSLVNPNIYTKDTLDYDTISYYKNNPDSELFTIFLQQKIISKMFLMTQYFFLTVAVQIGVHIILSIWYKNKGIRYNPVFKLDRIKTVTIVMVLVILCALVLNSYYNSSFLSKLQPLLSNTNTSLTTLKNQIYDNITTNQTFLDAMVNNDVYTMMNTINAQTNLNSVTRMIFSISLYNFFKINISENQEEFSAIIKRIFTIEQIRVRDINPMEYMYFGQNIFIPNLYPIIKAYITGPSGTLNNSAKEYRVRTDITNRINNINTQLITLFKLPSKRTSVRNYLMIAWTLGFLFVLGMGGIYQRQIAALYYNLLQPILSAIATKIKSKLTFGMA